MSPTTSFDDCELDPEAILGERTYENVLYTGDVDVVDVRTGETPPDLDRDVEKAIEFAENAGITDTPKVAKQQRGEVAVESRSPYSSCAFFHYSITGGMAYHRAYKAALEVDEFTVDFDANYRTGDLTIIVERTTETSNVD